jgi:tetratricopeptide (TPR) repeat protein
MTEEGGADSSLEKTVFDIKTEMLSALIKEKQHQLTASPANAAALENELKLLLDQRNQLELSNAESLVRRYPNDLMYRYDLGVLHMKTGNIPGAIEQFQRAVGQPQRRVSALNYLGLCFHQMGLHDLAVDQFVKAIAELPMMDNVKKEVTYNLGDTYAAMGDQEKAIAEFKKIAAVDFGYRDIKDRIIRKPPPQSPPSAPAS